MDFIIALQRYKGKSVILVGVDRLNKYAQFCALSHPFKVSTVVIALKQPHLYTGAPSQRWKWFAISIVTWMTK